MRPFLRSSGALLRWVLSALVESAVVMPWMLFFYASSGHERWPDALPGAWLPLLVFLVAGLWEAGDRTDDPRRRIAALLAGTAAAYGLAYLSLPAALTPGSVFRGSLAIAFVPVAAYLWYQGARGAIEGIEFGRTFSRILYQFLTLLGGIVALLMASAMVDPRVQLLLNWSVILFFAAGGSLMLVTRERALKQSQASLGEQGSGATITPVMVVVVVLLTALTLGASQLLSLERLESLFGTLGGYIEPYWSVAVKAALLIVVRWLMLLAPIGYLYRWMAARNQPAALEGEGEAPAAEPHPEIPFTEGSVNVEALVQFLLIAAALALLASWLYQLNRKRRQMADGEEERISLGFWRSLWTDLLGLLGLLRREAQPVAAAVVQAVTGGNPRDPRALYRRLQSWGAMVGRPRAIGETPNHYQAVLTAQRPDGAGPVAAVTALYNEVRYGDQTPEPEQVEQAARALEQLKVREGPK